MSHKTETRTTGQQLRLVRESLGLSLHEVERRSARAIKAQILGAYERGDRNLSIPRAQQLAEIYGMSLQQLLFAEPVTHTEFVLEGSAA